MALFKYLSYFILIVIMYFSYEYLTLPDIKLLDTCFKTSMNQVYLCPKSNLYVRSNQVSNNIKSAIVISEDAGFYSHSGFDVEELKKSFEKNIQKGRFARGGSTITQQLAKNLFLTKDKTITRKLKELILAKRIEDTYSKKIILEKYLNVVELGKNIYGVKAASEHYFGKHPSEVTPLEGAFLAFLLPSPEKYSISFKKKELTPFARKRLKDILFKMSHYKKISHEEYIAAKSQVDSLFKPVSAMEDEPELDDASYETEDGVYDLTEPIPGKDLEEQQRESLQIIEELKSEEVSGETNLNN